MAEDSESSQEKTEDATPRRLEKAREEGQIPRSRELNTMAVLIAGTGGLLLFGNSIAKVLESAMRYSFQLPRDVIYDQNQMIIYLGQTAMEAAKALAPIMGLLLLAALIAPAGLGGFLVSFKAAAPKFSRLNPLEGIKRMFSMHALVELAKAIAKVVLVALVAIKIIQIREVDLLQLGREPIGPAMLHSTTVIAWAFFSLACALILIAAVDVPFQLYEHTKKLRMSKQEVKDEYKDTEGKPEVKGRIRQVQREVAYRRMMQDVPKADVVITNPTHYAVALKYDGNSMAAPVVLAKGVDHTALKIREIAEAHKIEILSAPPLARSVYHHAEIGEEIPSGLYMAVAQVLAYVFQLRRFRAGKAKRPGKPPEFPIPKDLRRDS